MTTGTTGRGPRPSVRSGTTYLEVMVALSVTGITLAGLGSSVFSQLRLMGHLEDRVYLLVPQGTLLTASEDVYSGTMTYSGGAAPTASGLQGQAWAWARSLGVARLRAATEAAGAWGYELSAATVPTEPSDPPYEANHTVTVESLTYEDGVLSQAEALVQLD